MSDQDPISTMLTVIRNGQMAKKKQVVVTHSNIKLALLEVLKSEGYLKSVAVVQSAPGKRLLNVGLKYTKDLQPAIQTIKRVSKPSLRIYKKADQLTKVQDGFGISIVSTSTGVMTGFDAVSRKLGGEVLCDVT